MKAWPSIILRNGYLPGKIRSSSCVVTTLVFTLLLSACSTDGSSDSDNSSLTLPSLSIADTSVSEGDAGPVSMEFTVTLSSSSGSLVTVNYSTSDGTATAGSDYQSESDTIQFVAGTTSQTVNVTVNGDADVELDEILVVTLLNPTNATIARSAATGTITNDDSSGGISGLDFRPVNQDCIAPPRPSGDESVSIGIPFPGLRPVSEPTKMILEPVADPRWFVLQKSGQVVVFDPDNATDPGNPISASPYLDLSAVVRDEVEGGLLGMAFHPDYPSTPEIFLSYTINYTGPPMRSVISRLILDNVMTPSAPGAGTVEHVILHVDQDADNHNGGDIAFGPDGYLYIGFGDGGSAISSNYRAQDTTYLLGSMLRIDVLGLNPLDPPISPGNPYNIPGDNPFSANTKCGPGANANACPEIYAWGFRNPWRWSFDPDTGALWLADVGAASYEEVNIVERGGNYGWPCREGAHDFPMAIAACSGVTGLTDPVSEYTHTGGNAITGGFVYRGSAILGLVGRYVFADVYLSNFWALQSDGQGGYTNDLLSDSTFLGPVSFGVDQDGELYFTNVFNGRLHKIEPATGSATSDAIPNLLSETDCTEFRRDEFGNESGDITLPYSGLLPYDINASFWSDGAFKERYIGLSDVDLGGGTTITRNVDDGDWEFPNGTVIVKNFRLDGNLVETRHLMRHPDGVWAGYTYEWNADQTEAIRVRGGKTVTIDTSNGPVSWIFPSESQCMQCHTGAAGFSLGAETAQLNKDFSYPQTGRVANQLETIDHVVMFTESLPGPASGLPRLTDPGDTSASLEDRARAYLHTNCSQCHRPGGPTPSPMDLRYTTSLAATNACDELPLAGDLGIANARLIATGTPGAVPDNASRSLIIARASRRDSFGMPPLGSNVIDSDGIDLLTAWINGLSSCN